MGGDCTEVTNVRVALRCRPLSKKELGEGDVSVFRRENKTQCKLLCDGESGEKDYEFGFDFVYDEKSRQEEVFEDVGKPVVEAAFNGFNSTVFAYGQTGSGKSWSMTGDLSSAENRGLIPRINGALFEYIQSKKNSTRHFLVQVSFFEIYNEIIYDLLDPTPRKEKEKNGGLQIKEHPVLGIHVKGLQQLVATDAEKVHELMELGAKNRTVGATQMNAESSRSHSICLINVHQKDEEDESRNVFSKLNLVDLAGSERADRTGATGARLKEGANINKSLSTLGSVINGLVERGRGKKGVFIPYRDSKLTRVLQESLGGNSLCTMLATLSPARANAKETLSTLRYAARAKTIKVTVTKNEEASQISMLNDEVAKLKKMLAEKAAEAATAQSQGVDSEALRIAEEKLAQQIRETENMTKETWAEKQEESKRHEQEIARMKKAHKDAARRADAERRRRFQLLRQKADLELSVKELSLPAKWADSARQIRTLEARAKERRAHVGVFRDALAADLRGLRYREISAMGNSNHNLADNINNVTHHTAAAAALVKRGAAESVEARFGLLDRELIKLQAEEAALAAAADTLITDVQASYEAVCESPTSPAGENVDPATAAKDARKRERVKLVLDQCLARRDALRRDASIERAALVNGSPEHAVPEYTPNSTHADLISMARELSTELQSMTQELKQDETCPGALQSTVHSAFTALEERTAQAVTAASAVHRIVLKQLQTVAAQNESSSIRDKAQRIQPVLASSGNVVNAAIIAGLAQDANKAQGWAPDPCDKEASLTFDISNKCVLSSIIVQPGIIFGKKRDVNPIDLSIDGTDRHRTVILLSKLISWSSLRLRAEKAEGLFARPPVRFLLDILHAIDTVSPKGWLAMPKLQAVAKEGSAEAKDVRRIYFDELIHAITQLSSISDLVKANGKGIDIDKKFTASSELILAGQGVDGTNALVQVLSIAALKVIAADGGTDGESMLGEEKLRWKTRPTQVSVAFMSADCWKDLGKFAVDASTGRANLPSDVPTATRCRVKPLDFVWSEAKPNEDDKTRPACRIALEVIEHDNAQHQDSAAVHRHDQENISAEKKEDSVNEADAREADQVLVDELSATKDTMLAGIAAVVAGTRQIAHATANAQKAAAEAERGRAEELVSEIKMLQEEMTRIELQKRSAEERASTAVAKLEEAQNASKTAQSRQAAAESTYRQVEAKNKENQAALDHAHTDIAEKENKIETLEGAIREAETRVKITTDELSASKKLAEDSAQRCQDTEKALHQAKEKIVSLETAKEQSVAKVQDLSKKLSDLESTKRDAGRRLTLADNKVAAFEARLKAQQDAAKAAVEKGLGDAESKYQAEIAELKAALESAQSSTESDHTALADQVTSLDSEIVKLRETLQSAQNDTLEKSRALSLANARIEELVAARYELDKRHSALAVELKTVQTNHEQATAEAERIHTKHDAELAKLRAHLSEAEAKCKEAQFEKQAATEARDREEHRRVHLLEEQLQTAGKSLQEAQEKLKQCQTDKESERARAQAAEKSARAARAETASAVESAQEESARADVAERGRLEQQTAFLTLESDCDALKAQLEAVEADLTQAREAHSGTEASAREAEEAKVQAQQAVEAAELALAVAEEERDAAREKEESLCNEIESLREDLDNGSEAYVHLSNRLAEKTDELADAREQLEAYIESEQKRTREFLTANANLESEALNQAAKAAQESQRAYDQAQKAQQETDALRTGIRKANTILIKHLKKAHVKIDLPKGRLEEDSPVALIDVINTLVRATLEHEVVLKKRLALAERPAEVVEVDETADAYDSDFE